MPVAFWKFLYLFSSFSLLACVMSARWNVLAAERVDDWGRRLTLFQATRRTTLRFGLTSLILLGVFANLIAFSLGLGFDRDSWLRWTDAMWIAALAVLALVDLPASRALAHDARRAIHHRPSRPFHR